MSETFLRKEIKISTDCECVLGLTSKLYDRWIASRIKVTQRGRRVLRRLQRRNFWVSCRRDLNILKAIKNQSALLTAKWVNGRTRSSKELIRLNWICISHNFRVTNFAVRRLNCNLQAMINQPLQSSEVLLRLLIRLCQKNCNQSQ